MNYIKCFGPKSQKIFLCKQSILIVAFIVTVVVSCSSAKKIDTDSEPSLYTIQIPYFPDSLNIPSDNPMTKEGVELGRYLFYDGRMSGRTDSLMSCASCHKQSYSFECGIDNPTYKNGKTFGLTGIQTNHVMMPLINLVWINEGYMWNGFVNEKNTKHKEGVADSVSQYYHFRNLESFVWMMIEAPHECNGNVDKTVELIKKEPMYPLMFKKAFGTEEITIDRISKAIAQFVRTLISFDSKFDRYMRQEVSLTESEMRGFFLFETEKADCFHCHGSPAMPLWTTNLFMNNAKDVDFVDKNDYSYVTGNPQDVGKYRVPTLRNIEFTAPYMHDGRFSTLDEVLEFYNSSLKRSPYVDPLMINVNHGGMFLSEMELHDLKAFLLTLSDTSFLTNPAFSNPLPDNEYFIK